MVTITGRTKLVGLLGWPVGHSLSPTMHNTAFADLGIDWAYVPLPVAPAALKQALIGLPALGFQGVNVTVPHKQAVMRHMDWISPTAKAIGAVNTVHIQDGKFYGYNTDGEGFLNSLIEADCHPKGLRIVVLGAGGAARAVVFSMVRAEAASVKVLNRTANRAAFLVDDLVELFPDSHLSFDALTPETLASLDGQVDLAINTTSLGMSPNVDSSSWPAELPMSSRTVFCDLVYNPLETQLLARAKASGAKTIDGLGMLVHQGTEAFKQWTGQTPSVTTMRAACLAG